MEQNMKSIFMWFHIAHCEELSPLVESVYEVSMTNSDSYLKRLLTHFSFATTFLWDLDFLQIFQPKPHVTTDWTEKQIWWSSFHIKLDFKRHLQKCTTTPPFLLTPLCQGKIYFFFIRKRYFCEHIAGLLLFCLDKLLDIFYISQI